MRGIDRGQFCGKLSERLEKGIEGLFWFSLMVAQVVVNFQLIV